MKFITRRWLLGCLAAIPFAGSLKAKAENDMELHYKRSVIFVSFCAEMFLPAPLVIIERALPPSREGGNGAA